MELKFNVAARIAKPVEEVYEAVVNPDQLSAYFTTGGAEGRIEKGATVMWDFHDFPGQFPVKVIDAVTNKKIVLEWEATQADGTPIDDPSAVYDTRMTMTFESLEDGRTLISVTEGGWTSDEAGLKASYGNCEGWMQMMCSLKAWLEHGINLREGFYK